MIRQRYMIECYRGKVSTETLEYRTIVRAMDMPHARAFGRMRRPGLIVEVTPVQVKEKP